MVVPPAGVFLDLESLDRTPPARSRKSRSVETRHAPAAASTAAGTTGSFQTKKPALGGLFAIT
jgi:hypothetical protein